MLYLYLNDNLLNETEFTEFYNTSLGIYIYQDIEVNVDHLTVRN